MTDTAPASSVQVDFYQLSRDPAERVVPVLAQKVLGSGARLLVVGEDEGLRAAISKQLWDYKPNSFLAHGVLGEGNEAMQPILLADRTDAANAATMVMLADGQWREDAAGFARTFYLFPPDRIEEARAAWRSLGDKPGIVRKFWKQSGSRWVEGP